MNRIIDIEKAKPETADNDQPIGGSGAGAWYWIVATLLGGIILRLFGFIFLHKAVFCGVPWFDDAVHRTRALSLLIVDFPEKTLPWGSPAYPYFCAGIGKLFGHEISAVLITQLILGLGTALLLAWALAPILSRRYCWIAAFLYAINPIGLFFEMRLQPTALAMLLLVLIMRFIFWRIRPGRVAAAGGGLLIGAGILLKPWLFLLLAIAGVWLFLQRSKAFLPAALMILFALPLPILLSNYHASVEDGGAVLSSSNSFSFYQSLDPDSWGTPRSLTPPVWTDQETADGFAHEALGRQLTDYEMSNYYLTTAQKRMIEGPLNFIGLVARKFSLLLSGHEVPDPVSPSFVFSNSAPYLIWGLYLFPLLLVFGLLGMTELQRSEQFPLLLTPVAALCVANLTGVYSCASRWPLMLVWLPLAVIGITVIKKLNPFGGSKPRYLMPALLIILIGSMLDLPGAQSKLENRSEDFRYEAALAAKSLDSRGASRLLREAVKSDPNNAMAQADLAKQFAEEDLYQAALEGFEKALSIDPSNKIALYELSELFRSQKEYGRAESLAVALVEDHPNHPLYLNQLGVIQMMQNRYADARISLRRALEILPDYQVAIINLREVERKERATASLAFPEEFSPLPGTPLLQFSEKVRVAQQQQDIAEFDRLTKEGLEEFPGHPFPLFLRGSYFMTMKRFQEAAAALTQVAQLVPGRFVLTQSAAQALYEVGRTDDARDLIKRNLEQAAGPDNKSRIQRLLELFDESINSGGTQ